MRVGLEPGAESSWRSQPAEGGKPKCIFQGMGRPQMWSAGDWQGKSGLFLCGRLQLPRESKEGTDHVTGGGWEGGERCSAFAMPRGHFPPVPASRPRAGPHSSASPQQVAQSKNVVGAP